MEKNGTLKKGDQKGTKNSFWTLGDQNPPRGTNMGAVGRKRMEEEQIVFDQDEFGGKLRQFLWQYGHGMVHKGLATIGKRMPCKKLPGMNFLAPQLYFDEIADQQRLREIDLEIELEVARSGGEGEIGLAGSDVLGADGDDRSDKE